MKYFLLFMLMITIKVSLCHITHYLNCTRSRYFLNFFNHNERFLLQFEKNKDYLTIENLMNYGKALQTHGKVIMILLEDLIYNNSKNFPYTLITVNMYLNNISGSLNMIAKIDDDEKNDAQKLLEGYKIIHFAVKEQLIYYINIFCHNIPFNENMVSCNPPISENEYNTTDLIKINNELKGKIMTKLKFAIERNLYEKFHPKLFLFYDIMTLQNSERIELNLLRFTPLNVKCTNGTRLTIQDIFEYMKYDFNSKDVLPYIKMVIGATFRPIAILIRNYLTLIKVASSENSDNVKFWLKKNFIDIGQKIIKILIEFMSFSVFKNNPIELLNNILNKFNLALNNYVINKELSEINILHNNKLIKVLTNFFIKSKLYFSRNIILTNKNITENNADEIKNQLDNIIQKVEIYMIDLKKWNEYFNFIVTNLNIRPFHVLCFKKFIDFKIIDRICNTESHSEIWNISTNDKNNIEIGYYKDVQNVEDNVTQFNLKNLNDKNDEYDIKSKKSFDYISTYNPHYMLDYWPYNE
ncbi:uncharacterized protein PF3D7_1120600-like isoform X1 [Daktulosphaira vitifoliae]|uniref:uncharacterized protein PF3D7_1120600-like isoform X1 n=1 Tax=Daktulosphaira vitifoliae TaxID=58002 RepID=UPI0021AA101D|nr:uncharacterized protein PF3D7_1120600-like isoform X1 [Daktulosphaira vitifoliae]